MNSLDPLLDIYWRYTAVGQQYWGLFTVSNTAIFGWLISKKTPYPWTTRAWAVAGYLLFAGAVFAVLRDNAGHVAAARHDLATFAALHPDSFVPDSQLRRLFQTHQGFSWQNGLQYVYAASALLMTGLIARDVFSRPVTSSPPRS